MVIGDIDVLHSQHDHRQVVALRPRGRQAIALRAAFEVDHVAMLAVTALQVWNEHNPTGGMVSQMAGETAAIGSCRYCFRSSSAIGIVEK